MPIVVMGVVEYSGLANVDANFGDGYVYVGQRFNGMADGRGTLYRNDGHMVYVGDFRGNRYIGNGILFEEAQLDNEGESTYPYVYYEGEFSDGSPNGHGMCYAPIRTADYDYDGQKVVESGTLRYVTAVGSAKPDVYCVAQMEAMGRTTDAIEDTHNTSFGLPTTLGGEIVAGESDMPPVVAALKYEGEFSRGMLNGNGVEYFTSGQYKGHLRYEGAFADNRYDGKGTLYEVQSGKLLRVYEGEFSNGLFNGEGTLYNEDGTSVDGTFVEGVLVEER